MNTTSLPFPLRMAWSRNPILRGLGAIVGICFIAMVTIVLLGSASEELITFFLGGTIFFTALCLARPISGRVLAGERAAVLSTTLVIWVFLMVSETIFSHFQTTSSAVKGHVDPSAIYQALSWILSLCVLALISWSRPAYIRRLFTGPLKWAPIFAIVAVLSCPLSRKPMYSAALAFKLSVIVLTLCAIGEALEDETGIFRLFAGLFLGFLITVTRSFVVPLIGTGPTFEGNRFGAMVGLSGTCGILLLLCVLFFTLRRNPWFLACGLYSVVVMMLAGTKGGMVASFVSFMMYFVLLKRPAQAIAASFVLAIVLGLCIAFTPLGKNLEKYTESGSAGTLTGRTNLWAAAWPNIKSHPILGNGYRASRFLSEEVPGAFQEAGNMHNSVLELLYNNGLAGLIPILVITILTAVNLKQIILRPTTLELRYYAAAALAIQIHLLVWGLVAVTFGGAPDDRFMTFFAMFLISIFLRGRCDKKYWKTVYGDRLA